MIYKRAKRILESAGVFGIVLKKSPCGVRVSSVGAIEERSQCFATQRKALDAIILDGYRPEVLR